MAKTYPCERVDLDFIDAAPFRFVSTVDLAITPEQLFEVLGDAESWPHWATRDHQRGLDQPASRAASAPPGPSACAATSSATRSSSRGSRSPTWHSGSTRARRTRISAFAEDYRVVQTADGCHLTWVMAMKPSGLAGRLGMIDGTTGDGRGCSSASCTTCGATPTSGTLYPRAIRSPRCSQYRPAHAERRRASGSATVSSRVERMTRVRRSLGVVARPVRHPSSTRCAKFSQVRCMRLPTDGCTRRPSGWILRPRYDA